jgi:hypothetical protein
MSLRTYKPYKQLGGRCAAEGVGRDRCEGRERLSWGKAGFY